MLKNELIEIGNEPYRKSIASEYLWKNKRKHSIKSKIVSFLIGCAITLAIFSVKYISVNASDVESEPIVGESVNCLATIYKPSEIVLKCVEMTYYTETSNTCANGKYPRNGICAYRKQDIGKCAIIYTLDYELIGYFEIYDTGYGREESNGKGTIQNGNCVDIFAENESFGRELIEQYGNKVLIQIVDGKG